MTSTSDVLICGAGPTGLVLALRLVRSGVRVRIVDAAAQAGTTSRAIVVQARTVEFYRQMGLAEAFLEHCLKFEAANLWVRGRHVAHVTMGEVGTGLSPYPYLNVCTQDRHERFLIERLRAAGLEVERPVELLDFEQLPDRVRARLRNAHGVEETCEAAYLAGCDGARSRVREVLGIGFPGGTYSHVFYVADVEASGPVMNDELHIAVDEAEFLAIFPLRGKRSGRLIGLVRAEVGSAREKPTWEDVGQLVARRMGIDVERVNWFSTYRVHHRVASKFRQGRAFLLGDAAHIHSPVGAQGMNTGIGDAVNLSWKLADVVQGRAAEGLLDSYEPERIAFARQLVSTTDRAFTVVTSESGLARLIRVRVVPRVLPALFRLTSVRRFWFRALSQIAIRYPDSVLSGGSLGSLRGGDRLPWVEGNGTSAAPDNFAVLDGLRWQVHVYGTAGAGLAEACQARGLSFQVFPWREAMAGAGLTRNALYLLRPDGYIARMDPEAHPAALSRHLSALPLR